jgi:hypothetical protein
MDIDKLIHDYVCEFDTPDKPQEVKRIPEKQRRLLAMAIGLAAFETYPPTYCNSEPTYHAVDYMPESDWDTVVEDIESLM